VGVTIARDLGARAYLDVLVRDAIAAGLARGRDYLPDSGRFDVSAPGTPFASGDQSVNLRLLTEATRRRRV